ncbi:MAG: hypothetical protein CME71_03405 [Halobacteriovorax sp.]|nr:hypothetical protein [Halobacteriovorax sp.]
MNTIKHYLEIYRNFVATSTAEALSFRLNFLMITIVDTFFLISTLGSAYVLFSHVETIGPWNRDQLLFFLCFMLAVDDFQNLFVTNNFWMLSSDLKEGNLDYVFLKPVKSLFPLFFKYLRIASLGSVVSTIILLIYFGLRLDFELLQWALLPLLLLLALTLRSLIEMAIALLMFWTTEGTGINFIRLQLQSVSRWPDFIYKGLAKKALLTLVPVLLIGSAPLRFLFDFEQWQMLALLIVLCFVFFFVVRTMWTGAKYRYESASS